jgi:hypothetical protein
MNEVLLKLQKSLEEKNILDFRFLKLTEDSTLSIIGSFDFGYYHDVENIFYGVTYISCPTYFIDAIFRLATEAERYSIKEKLFDGWDDFIICIAIDENLPGSNLKHYIVAKEVRYIFEKVYYYKRGNLKEGERIAEWVK